MSTTRNAGMKLEISDGLKLDINDKFNKINDKQVIIKSGFKENLDDLVAEGLSKIKDSIIEALCKKIHHFIKRLKI